MRIELLHFVMITTNQHQVTLQRVCMHVCVHACVHVCAFKIKSFTLNLSIKVVLLITKVLENFKARIMLFKYVYAYELYVKAYKLI